MSDPHKMNIIVLLCLAVMAGFAYLVVLALVR